MECDFFTGGEVLSMLCIVGLGFSEMVCEAETSAGVRISSYPFFFVFRRLWSVFWCGASPDRGLRWCICGVAGGGLSVLVSSWGVEVCSVVRSSYSSLATVCWMDGPGLKERVATSRPMDVNCQSDPLLRVILAAHKADVR